jgi:hypothetical protein
VSEHSDEPTGPLVKGTVLLDALAVLHERLGVEAYLRLLTALDPAARQVLAGGALPGEWYSLEVLTGLMRTSMELNEAGEGQVMADAEELVTRHLRGVYAFFVRLGSPEWLIKRIAALHARYFRNLKISPTFEGAQRARIRYEGLAPKHRILALGIVGFYRKALELSGARSREVRITVPIEAGTDCLELALSW